MIINTLQIRNYSGTGHELSLVGNNSDVALLIISEGPLRRSRAMVIVYCRIRERLFNVAERYAIMPLRRTVTVACIANSLSGLPRIDVINPLPPTEHCVIAVRNSLSRVIPIVMELRTLIGLNLHPAVSYTRWTVIAPSDD